MVSLDSSGEDLNSGCLDWTRVLSWRVSLWMGRGILLAPGLVDVEAATLDNCYALRRWPRTVIRSWPYGAGWRLLWLGWKFWVACATGFSARSTRPKGGDMALCWGDDPGCLIWRSWSADSFHLQLGLQVAGSCDIATREWVMECQESSVESWSCMTV
jgi:hypothetical protein